MTSLGTAQDNYQHLRKDQKDQTHISPPDKPCLGIVASGTGRISSQSSSENPAAETNPTYPFYRAHIASRFYTRTLIKIYRV